MNKAKYAPFPFSAKLPWSENSASICIASIVKLYRNLAKFSFPPKLHHAGKEQIISLVEGAFEQSKAVEGYQVFKADQLKPLEKEFLFEHFFDTENIHQAYSGEAFVVDPSGTFLACINLKDHLQIQISACENEIERSWNQLVDIETKLGTILDYAFKTKFGFLTASPQHCGTALLSKVFLHLPCLISDGQIKTMLEAESSLKTSALHGGGDSFVGDLVILENQHTLGLSSEDIISSLHAASMRLIVAEKALRNKQEHSKHFKDRVSRSFGLLMNSFQIDTKEALDALSMCKLGIDLEWIKNADHRCFNELFFFARRAHLQSTIKGEIDQGQLAEKRSEFLRNALKKLRLKIH